MGTEARSETSPKVGAGPAVEADGLADLVEVLLPGGGVWPSGKAVGVQAVLALRLLQERGRAELARVTAAVLAAGGPLAGLDEAARIAVVGRFEAEEPALFGLVRDIAYVSYYENPFVAEAINAQGHPYDLRPHIKGYPVPRFDLARDTPRHGRGRYVPTGAVRRVDVSGLDLTSDATQSWGLKR